MDPRTELATLGGGCFWCVEAIYQNLKGVRKVVSGYAGGRDAEPSYKEVCSGMTGHAEVIQITFDPEEISYEDILYVFWRAHDPTTMNRQGADVGTQYRSVIYYQDEHQKERAERSKMETNASGLWSAPLVTEISPMIAFYPAEDYHQNFYRNNPQQPYCLMVIDPKIQKFKKTFQDMLA